MASYPENRFIQEFARRTANNLCDVNAGRKISFDDTALIGFLLAVFVLPHERDDCGKFMKEILGNYRTHKLSEVVTVLRPKEVEANTDGELPKSLRDIPKFMRHAIAHLNIKPESADGNNLTHLLVWNRPPSKPINFVAQVHIGRLRSLALHVLNELAKGNSTDKYEHIDPVAEYDKSHGQSEPG